MINQPITTRFLLIIHTKIIATMLATTQPKPNPNKLLDEVLLIALSKPPIKNEKTPAIIPNTPPMIPKIISAVRECWLS